MLRNTIRIIFLLVFIAAIAALIYANFYEPTLYGPALVGAIVAGVLWYLVTFQFLTEKGRPGVITSKTDAAVSRAHAAKLTADAEVVKVETEIIKNETEQQIAVLKRQEAQNTFYREEELKRALQENQLLIAKRATERGIAVGDYTRYLLTVLQEQTKYETARMIAFTEIENERKKLVETIRFTLEEGSLKFDERLKINEQLVKLDGLIKKSRNREERERLQQQREVLQAKWNELIGQINLSQADGAKA